ncbi:MAG TPA: GNAT family N-acetyltransferase [Thermoanaerobaculia bacterium]|nr:GNAT family N-acetyltransferase [Thermoanaerobaculia bacterium]
MPLAGGEAAIELRRLRNIGEYRRCEELQQRIWGPDDVGCVSALVMITAQENGGATFGAFAGGSGGRGGSGRLVGFVCGFLGSGETGRPKLCSVLLAVDPDFRGRGIAYELKRRQRDAALAQGIELITWTYDPLASVNAGLNLGRLGCVCSRYLPNCYGLFTGGINAGIATDRFLVEWRVGEPRVEQALRGELPPLPYRAPLVAEVKVHASSGLPVPLRWHLARDEPALLVEAPPDIHAIKRTDIGLARCWLYAFREIFPHYFARGYEVAGFGPLRDPRRRAYLLRVREHGAAA